MRQPEILLEDKEILVCIKPDGMPAQSDKSTSQDLVSYLKTRLSEQAIKKGQPLMEPPYLVPVHRLDRPVGGIMVLARTSGAAAELSRQVQEHEMVKYYQAVVTGHLPEAEGSFLDYLVRDGRTNLSRVVPKEDKAGKKAVLHYEVLDELETDVGDFSYILIRLETGRHHQIRCQLAHHGAAIYGDTKYNPLYQKGFEQKGTHKKKSFKHGGNPGQVALIATRLEFTHPATKQPMVFKTEPWGRAFDILDLDEF
ncbi:MAG: RNA pseudouridine synthase [Lachnospira sp.]|nr:RNA pseudouridine synthase [Lachnospira sp.]